MIRAGLPIGHRPRVIAAPSRPAAPAPQDVVELGASAVELPAWLDRQGDYPSLRRTLSRDQATAAEVLEVLKGARKGAPEALSRLEEFLDHNGTRIQRPVRAFLILRDLFEPVCDPKLSPRERLTRLPSQIDLGLLTNRASGIGYDWGGYCALGMTAWLETLAEERAQDYSSLLAEVRSPSNAGAVYDHLSGCRDLDEAVKTLADFARTAGSPGSGTTVERLELWRSRQRLSELEPSDGLTTIGEILGRTSTLDPDEAASLLLSSWVERHGPREQQALREALRSGELARGVLALLQESDRPVESLSSLCEVVGLVGAGSASSALDIQRNLDLRLGRGEDRRQALSELLRATLVQAGTESENPGSIEVYGDQVRVGTVVLNRRSSQPPTPFFSAR
ncbi:MAG: hypothetical protein HY319_17315 [Armatimonadetes bacterium]|nr:hypothetical protein [Armatimonadota bacterium]